MSTATCVIEQAIHHSCLLCASSGNHRKRTISSTKHHATYVHWVLRAQMCPTSTTSKSSFVFDLRVLMISSQETISSPKHAHALKKCHQSWLTTATMAAYQQPTTRTRKCRPRLAERDSQIASLLQPSLAFSSRTRVPTASIHVEKSCLLQPWRFAADLTHEADVASFAFVLR